MGERSLQIKKIHIKKMPGLREGLAAFEDLSPHINIIAGPNASGKSSSARAIQQLIWQDATDGLKVEATFDLEGKEWSVDIDHSHRHYLKNGETAQLQVTPPVESKKRYMLSLHHLIQAEEKDLAAQILKDAIGGYDVDKAIGQLNYSAIKSTKNISEYKKWEAAKTNVSSISLEHQQLYGRQKELSRLKEEKDEARKATALVEFYALLIDYFEKNREKKMRKEALSQFPDTLQKGRVKENDYEKLEELENKISETNNTITGLQKQKTKLQEEKQSLQLPESGIDGTRLRELDNNLHLLQKLEDKILNLKDEVSHEKTLLEETERKFGYRTEFQQFEGLDMQNITITTEKWQQAFDVHGKIRRTEREIQRLQEAQVPTHDVEDLNQGIDSLAKWLRSVSGERAGKPKSLFWLALVAVLISAAAILLFAAWGFVIVAIFLIAITFIYFNWNPASSQEANTRKSDFLETGLEPPSEWEVEAVRKRLEALSDSLQIAKQQEDRNATLRSLREDLSRLQANFQNIEKEFQVLREKLTVIPGLNEGQLNNYSSLYYFFTYVKEWQSHHAALKAKTIELDNARADKEEKLEKINALLSQFNQSTVNDHAGAKAEKDRLEDLKNKFDRLQREIETSEKELEQAEGRNNEATQELRSLHDRLSMEVADKGSIKTLVDLLPKYTEARQELYTAEKFAAEIEARLQSHPLFEKKEDEIKTLDPEELKKLLESNREKADRLEELNKEITGIETMIANVKRKHHLEDALSAKEEALEDLQKKYRENAASISGHLLATQLQAQLNETNKPEVLDKAEKLFIRITKGRYTLDVSGKQGPGFRARDTVDGIWRSLHELSTGTKIQLLLSVRLAFIEQSEGEVKLPILADELLANSDSARATAIIEALTELSREGRQIFYFTAQEDEVAKWKTHLQHADDLQIKTFVIQQPGKAYHDMDTTTGHVFSEQFITRDVPPPGKRDHHAYGKELKVPAFRILRDPLGKLHLWYLLEDIDMLYNALKMGMSTWGELLNFLKAGGRIEGFDQEVRDKLLQKAKLIKNYMELRRHGHHRAIDRQVLEESDAVTPKFIVAVSEKLDEYDGDPGRLLIALQNGEVPGFFSSKREELETYLLQEGYLVADEPYTEEEIRIRLMAAVSRLGLEMEEVEKLLKRLS